MSAESTAQRAPGTRTHALREHLFRDESAGAFAVLDGASVKGLVRGLETNGASSACLFAGKLHPSVARVAPYLVELREGGAATDWILDRCWGRHWGIFLECGETLDALRKHLRRFLQVKDPKGRAMLFRYYDPRVLRLYLPTCNRQEMDVVFGPVQSYAMESEDADSLLVFTPDVEEPRLEAISVGIPLI